jgi:Flp pilus assembly protein TadD
LLRRIQKEDPGYLPAYTALGQLYVVQQRSDEALAEFRSLAQRDPASVSALTNAAMILERQGKRSEAEHEYERALQVDGSAPIAANNLAWMYAEAGRNLDVALQLAQTAYAKVPNDPTVADTLGFVYYKKGLLPQATRMLRQAVDKDITNPLFHYHLGLALAGAGDAPGASRHLTRAISLKSDFEGAAEARTLLQTLQSH